MQDTQIQSLLYFFYPKSCLITPITLFPINVYCSVLLYLVSQPNNCCFQGVNVQGYYMLGG